MTGKGLASAHPPLPPTQDSDWFAWLRLLRSRRVGISTFWRLLDEHGSAAAALDALPGIAATAGIADYAICPEGVVAAELKAGKAAGARLLRYGDADYPPALTDIAERPPLLWCIGRTDLLRRPMIAMVGARNASSLGTRMARHLAQDLSQAGFVVVSGLARGVDTAAHDASLAGGTVAVMAGGVDVIYPAENTDLAHRIRKDGLLVSDQPMGTQPQARHFPARNRLISGLSSAVVVVEAAARSGSLITARNALDQGRDVLAVPGHPFDARAAGCNMLLRDGATLIRSARDVIEAVGGTLPDAAVPSPDLLTDTPSPARLPQPTATPRSLRDTATLHMRILDRLGPSPVAEDQLIRDLATPSHQVAPVLMDLELDGHITRLAGGLLARREEQKRPG